MMTTIKFYDTCSLLLKAGDLFNEENFAISSITLQELESIKVSSNKDEDVKYSARKILQDLDQNPDKYKIVIYQNSYLKPIIEKDFETSNDVKILACAIELSKTENLIFITNDLALKHIAKVFLLNVDSIPENTDDYLGYKDIKMTEDEMVNFYSNQSVNSYNLSINEYLIVRNLDNEIVDKLCWTGSEYRHLDYKSFNSKWFGEIKPMKNYVYQS